tara:strand:+ start:1635 stop:1736 length:102 start_codon:yes stop_codon:yes gene_type:complete
MFDLNKLLDVKSKVIDKKKSGDWSPKGLQPPVS